MATSNNSFYHNNFLNNGQQVYDSAWDNPEVSSSVNVWDDGYPSGGNYWSDYEGYDLDGDGIGDMPHKIVNVFDHLEGNYPRLRLFLFSAAAQALALAERGSPVLERAAEEDVQGGTPILMFGDHLDNLCCRRNPRHP